MTDRPIEELAAEVARDISIRLSGFAIESIDETTGALHIRLSWKQPVYIQVTIILRDYDTDATVKDQIRRELQNAA